MSSTVGLCALEGVSFNSIWKMNEWMWKKRHVEPASTSVSHQTLTLSHNDCIIFQTRRIVTGELAVQTGRMTARTQNAQQYAPVLLFSHRFALCQSLSHWIWFIGTRLFAYVMTIAWSILRYSSDRLTGLQKTRVRHGPFGWSLDPVWDGERALIRVNQEWAAIEMQIEKSHGSVQQSSVWKANLDILTSCEAESSPDWRLTGMDNFPNLNCDIKCGT